MRKFAATLCLLSIVMPPAFAEDGPTPIEKSEPTPITWKSIELTKAGELHGQMLNESGKPLVHQEIRVLQKNAQQTLLTDDNGRFVCRNLKSGACAVEHGDNGYALRIWRNGMAPPNALKNFALVAGQGDIARGNMPIPFPIPLPPIVLPAFPHAGLGGGTFAGGGIGAGVGSVGTAILGAGAIAGGFVAINEAQDDDDAS